jgi:hypothetical protein
MDGRPDGREFGVKVRRLTAASTPVSSICRTFLWHRYQYDAEGLPDRFSFETSGSTTLIKGMSYGCTSCNVFWFD